MRLTLSLKGQTWPQGPGKQGDNEKLSGTGVIGAVKNSGGLWEAEESLFEELDYKNGEISA